MSSQRVGYEGNVSQGRLSPTQIARYRDYVTRFLSIDASQLPFLPTDQFLGISKRFTAIAASSAQRELTEQEAGEIERYISHITAAQQSYMRSSSNYQAPQSTSHAHKSSPLLASSSTSNGHPASSSDQSPSITRQPSVSSSFHSLQSRPPKPRAPQPPIDSLRSLSEAWAHRRNPAVFPFARAVLRRAACLNEDIDVPPQLTPLPLPSTATQSHVATSSFTPLTNDRWSRLSPVLDHLRHNESLEIYNAADPILGAGTSAPSFPLTEQQGLQLVLFPSKTFVTTLIARLPPLNRAQATLAPQKDMLASLWVQLRDNDCDNATYQLVTLPKKCSLLSVNDGVKHESITNVAVWRQRGGKVEEGENKMSDKEINAVPTEPVSSSSTSLSITTSVMGQTENETVTMMNEVLSMGLKWEQIKRDFQRGTKESLVPSLALLGSLYAELCRGLLAVSHEGARTSMKVSQPPPRTPDEVWRWALKCELARYQQLGRQLEADIAHKLRAMAANGTVGGTATTTGMGTGQIHDDGRQRQGRSQQDHGPSPDQRYPSQQQQQAMVTRSQSHHPRLSSSSATPMYSHSLPITMQQQQQQQNQLMPLQVRQGYSM